MVPFVAGLSAGGAMAAIRGNHAASPRGKGSQAANGEFVRTIVFQGSADTTVHPSNGRSVASAAEDQGELVDAEETNGSRGGRRQARPGRVGRESGKEMPDAATV